MYSFLYKKYLHHLFHISMKLGIRLNRLDFEYN